MENVGKVEDGELAASHHINIHIHVYSLIPGNKDDLGNGTGRSLEEQVGLVMASFHPLQAAVAPSLILCQEAEDTNHLMRRTQVNDCSSSSSSSSNSETPMLSVGVASMYVQLDARWGLL